MMRYALTSLWLITFALMVLGGMSLGDEIIWVASLSAGTLWSIAFLPKAFNDLGLENMSRALAASVIFVAFLLFVWIVTAPLMPQGPSVPASNGYFATYHGYHPTFLTFLNRIFEQGILFCAGALIGLAFGYITQSFRTRVK